MNRLFKIFLMVVVMMALLFPMLQERFNLVHANMELYGAFAKAEDTTFTTEGWSSRRYQDKKEAWLNENFGFRNFLVKLNNQVNFTCYGEINVKDVFRGKNNYLFSHGFFNNYSGRTYKGDQYVDAVMDSLQRLNDALLARGKKLLVCIIPNKESFFPEFLPDSCKAAKSGNNYYDKYSSKLRNSKIPYLDYTAYIRSLKSSSKYALFTQGAVHWTTYSGYLALDTLLKRVASETNKKVNLIRIKSVEMSDTARDFDDDISKAMNLLQSVNSEKMGYPIAEYVYPQDSCYKPKVMVIGDSFYYILNNTWMPLSIFSRETYFLYYFRKAIPYNTDKKDCAVNELDLKKELENTDIVILFSSIGTLNTFPYNAPSIIEHLK